MVDSSMSTRFDVRHLVTLAYVARLRSFTEAASELGYSQSAISQHIHRLELLVGEHLFDRGRGLRDVTVTPAGQVLLRHAEAVVATMERAAIDIGALSRGAAGVLRVGCFESVGAWLLGPVLQRMRDSYPDVQIIVTDLPDDADLLRLVEADQLDLTFTVLPLSDGPFITRVILADPYVLVVGQNSPLCADEGPIDLADIDSTPLMSYAALREPHSLGRRSGHPEYGARVIFRSNHNATLMHLASCDYAAAVVTNIAVMAAPTGLGLHVRPLADVQDREIGLTWHDTRALSPVAETFIEMCQIVAQELLAQGSSKYS